MRFPGFFLFLCTVWKSDSLKFSVNVLKHRAVWFPDSTLSDFQTAKNCLGLSVLSGFQTVYGHSRWFVLVFPGTHKFVNIGGAGILSRLFYLDKTRLHKFGDRFTYDIMGQPI